MAAIPASALLGQFAEEITPAGQAVFGLNAQPFVEDYGAIPGEIQDAGRGNVAVSLARKALDGLRRVARSEQARVPTDGQCTIHPANT